MQKKLISWMAPFSLSFLTLTVHASTPVWITEATGQGGTLTIANGEVKTVEYIVTNNSLRPKQLALQASPGLAPAQGCDNLQPKSSCSITLPLIGDEVPAAGIHGGPVLCQQNLRGRPNPNQCYQPSVADQLNVTKVNTPSSPALSFITNSVVLAQQGIFTELAGVNQTTCETIFGSVWNGTSCVSKSRTLQLVNRGNETISNISFNFNPALPAGTTVSPSSCTNLAPQSSCQLTITPGATPSGLAGSAPVASEITPVINDVPLAITSAKIIVLTYGNIYQGGYIFDIQDLSTGITGKVAAQMDQATSIAWGGSPSNVWGIDDTSLSTSPSPSSPPAPFYPGQEACNGQIDGFCNTNNIVVYFTNNPSPSMAQICRELTSGGYSNWYLPANCELSYNSSSDPALICGPQNAPFMQNVKTNIVNQGLGGFALLAPYFTSTEAATSSGYDPSLQAWIADLNGGLQVGWPKTNTGNLRCIRKF